MKLSLCRCVTVLNFSEPARDPSFRSKALLAGVLIFATVAFTVLGIHDSWLYFHLWEYKGHQIILQVRCSCWPAITPKMPQISSLRSASCSAALWHASLRSEMVL